MTTLSEPVPGLVLVSDAELVAASLSGDRDAFGRIVERYQGLVCALSYSATGGLAQSEDLAQETFLEAWRQLGSLREPEKLRSWLCGILRHKVGRMRRSERQEPIHGAETLEVVQEMESAEAATSQVVIRREEQLVLWNALERLPETYREPLILYYREDRSVEHVAVALDLSEDAVKQRLARGRRMLQEQVLAFVEGGLTRSSPGRLFTLGVLLALPHYTPPVKAAGVGVGVGVAAVKGGALAKTTGLLTFLASMTGVVSAVLTLRANLDQARTPRERRAIVKVTAGIFFGALGFLAGLYLLRVAAMRWTEAKGYLSLINHVLLFAAVGGWPVLVLRVMRQARERRSEERRRCPELFSEPRDQVGSAAGVYRSRFQLFGVPWVHCRFSAPDAGEKPVFGWIAGGDRAYGLLFAWGGVAVAPVSIGAVSVGVLSVGSLSVGLISLGTISVGWGAVGCAAIGVRAFAWLSAVGWDTARSDGFAIARNAAVGPVAWAGHANDSVARAMLSKPAAGSGSSFLFLASTVLVLVPMVAYARAVRRRLGKSSRE